MKTLTRFPSPRTMRQHPLRLLSAGLHAALLSAPLYGIFLVLFLSGCIREELTAPAPGTGRTVIVNYSFDTPQTRAAATGAEREVKDVAIFFYNADDANPNNETYVDCQSVSVSSSIGGSSGSFPLPLPNGILEGKKYKLILIGNYKKYAPEGKSLTEYAGLHNTRTYSKMKQELQAQLEPEDARVTTRLPFWGRLLGKDGNETTLTGPAPTDTNLGVSVRFSRAVARFDLINLAAGQLRIAWVKVCNYRSRGYLFHESMPAGEIVRGTAAEAPGLPLPSGYVPAPEPTGDPGALRQTLNTGGLYAFPNTVSYTSQDDKATTSLMIAGYYQNPKETTPNTTKLTYYRANVGDNGSSQILRRNYIYTLVINNVKKEGSDTEDGAVNEKEKLLDYVVGDDWDSDDGSTVTDAVGNFLTLSRTSVVLGSEKNESALIKVAVKEGTGWKLEWKNNAENAFRYEKTDDNSFSIITTGNNATTFTRNAALKVSVTGIAAPLELTVNVIQLSSISDPQMLTVEGKLGEFDYTVPGQGAEISLQVITGSPTSRWKTEADNDLQRMTGYVTPDGANKGFVNLSFQPNTGMTRTGTLTVKRLLPDGSEDKSVAPVKVIFKQDKSPYVVSLLPNYSANGLTIEGFRADKGNPNGIAANYRFSVILADPEQYKFRATCNFNKDSDAFITLDNEDKQSVAGPLQTATSAPSIVEGEDGNDIWLNVFRTGPGDADIKGDLIVTAVPKSSSSDLQEASYSVSITIKTSCKIGDSKIGQVLWADRNVGTTPRGQGGAAVGLNYTNDSKSDDHANTRFKGQYYPFEQASGKCTAFGEDNHYDPPLNDKAWRLPSKTEQEAVVGKLCFSKQRGFIISDDTAQGTVGCWFPFSGHSNTAYPYGYYWSSTVENQSPYWLYIDNGTASINQYYLSDNYTVRCVRDITPAPAAR